MHAQGIQKTSFAQSQAGVKMKKNNVRKNKFLKLFSSPVKKGFSAVVFFFSNIILITLICMTIFFAMTFRTRWTVNLNIIFSSVVCSFLTVLLTLIWTPVLRKKILAEETEREIEMREKDEEIERQKNEIQVYQENEADLKTKISLLENLTFNQHTYQNVLKLCFLNAESASTIKQREILNEKDNHGLGKVVHGATKEYDELISVINYKASYQLGIDINKLKITKTSHDTIIISGLDFEFTSAPRFEYDNFFTEYRHVKLSRDERIKEIEVLDDDASRDTIIKRQSKYKSDFEDSYLSGKNTDDETSEAMQKAKDFITLLLKPIYRHVQFEEKLVSKNALPFLDYLRQEIDEYKNRLSVSERKKISDKSSGENL